MDEDPIETAEALIAAGRAEEAARGLQARLAAAVQACDDLVGRGSSMAPRARARRVQG